MTRKDAERQEYLEKLREILKPGDVVYTTVKHVSRSGMSRSIDVHIIRGNEPRWLSYWVAKALGRGFDDKRECVKSSGCGMDMGFELVYALSSALSPNGFGVLCSKCKRRPTTKEEAVYRQDPANAAAEAMHGNDDHLCEFYGRNGDPSGWDNDGGYALEQKWM